MFLSPDRLPLNFKGPCPDHGPWIDVNQRLPEPRTSAGVLMTDGTIEPRSGRVGNGGGIGS